jgi:hypothetical protein
MVNIWGFRAGDNLMIDKLFSRRTKFMSQKQWLSGASSRENTVIFLRSDTLRE